MDTVDKKRRRLAMIEHFGTETPSKHTIMPWMSNNSSNPNQRKSGFRIAPNDPCPCKSGKKFKKCCQWLDMAQAEEKTVPNACSHDSKECSCRFSGICAGGPTGITG
jgi:hypothetical protein